MHYPSLMDFLNYLHTRHHLREWLRNRNRSQLEKLVFTEDDEADAAVTDSPQVSTYRPDLDLQQLSGLQGLTESIDEVEDVTQPPRSQLLETDLQQLLNELSRDRFKAPTNPWDIRTAAEKFRNSQGNKDNKIPIKEVKYFDIFGI